MILQEFFDLAVCQSAQQPGLTVGYIPLDNRPVNDLRPVLQAQSAGLRVRMPREALYATRLDNQSPTANGTTYGARQALLDWLHRNADACDILVISLDQLLSGGLVSSRALQGGDLQFEYEAIDYLSDLARQKPVYVFDTVMRLASTVGYQGLTGADYVAYRNYGMQPRQSLTGNALTPEAMPSTPRGCGSCGWACGFWSGARPLPVSSSAWTTPTRAVPSRQMRLPCCSSIWAKTARCSAAPMNWA